MGLVEQESFYFLLPGTPMTSPDWERPIEKRRIGPVSQGEDSRRLPAGDRPATRGCPTSGGGCNNVFLPPKRYETTWMMLHKLRRAMVAPERSPLNGPVEVDESFIGGPEAVRGRFFGDRKLVVVAVEVRAGSGRLRMQVINDAFAPTLTRFVTTNVSAGSIVHTDGWTAYSP